MKRAEGAFWPRKLEDWFDAVSKILLIIGPIIAGIWAYYEYLDRRKEESVSQTIAYARRFSSEPLLGAQERIEATWYNFQDELNLLATVPVSSIQEFEARKRQLVMEVVSRTSAPSTGSTVPRPIFQDIDEIVSFFGELKVCVTARVCDQKTAEGYFKDYALRFYCLHEPYIKWKAAEYSQGYGADLKSFAFSSKSSCR